MDGIWNVIAGYDMPDNPFNRMSGFVVFVIAL